MELDPEWYRDHSQPQLLSALDPIDRLVLSGNEAVLDVGCGDGRGTARLAVKVPNGTVLGIDSSLAMIQYASATWPHISFEQRSGEQMHEQSSFDVITAFSSLHWMRHPQKVIASCYAALRSGGRLLILTYPKDSLYWDLLTDVLERPDWKRLDLDPIRHHFLSSSELAKILEDVGFKDIRSEVSLETANYATSQALVDYMRGWMPCLIALSDADQRHYLAEVVQLAQEKYGTANGSLAIPYTKLVLWATRA